MILVTLDRSRLFTPWWMGLIHFWNLLYGILTCWSVLTGKYTGTYPPAAPHGSMTWTSFRSCIGLRSCTYHMFQQVEVVWSSDRNRRASGGWFNLRPSSLGLADLVRDFWAVTMEMANDFLLLSEHRRFCGCRKEEGCVKEFFQS